MASLSRMGSLIRNLFRRERVKRDLDDEVRSHFEMLVEENLSAGMSEREARRAARIELGGFDQVKEKVREVRMGAAMEQLGRDVRYGLRMMRRNPGFAAIAILTLALGIGANTAIFTLLNAVLLKSLPVEKPEQLVLFSDTTSEGTSTGNPPVGEWHYLSYPLYEYFREHNESFQSLSAFRRGEDHVSVREDGAPSGAAAQRANSHLVSGTYFSVLGVNAILGRVLTPADDAPPAPPAAVISYGYWKEKWNRDPSIVGRIVLLNGIPFTIVGVTPPEFFGERVRHAPDFWLPLAFQPQIELQESFLTDPSAYWLNVIGRLKPGVKIEQAQANGNGALQQYLTEREGAQLTDDRRKAIRNSYVSLTSGSRGISGLRFLYSQPLRLLMAIVALVLLIACANVGNLLLSRSASRRMEISMRLALGASRSHLARQLLTESLLLAVIGGACGVLIARWGVSALVVLVARTSPLDVSTDLSVLGFTAGISLIAVIFFGLAPAMRATRTDFSSALKEGAALAKGGRLRTGLGPALVVSQVALSLVLLMGAGLFARSLLKLEHEDVGFKRDHVLLAGIDTRLTGYKASELSGLSQRLLERVSALPAVRAASVATYSPISGSGRTGNISLLGYVPRPGEDMVISYLLVGPNYCEALGLHLLQGRAIGPQDTPTSPKVAMVNESFARYFFFHGENPIGRRFGFGNHPDQPERNGEIEIVGVVNDAKYDDIRTTPTRTAYLPIMQTQDGSAFLSELEIRTEGDPLSIATEIRSAIAQVDDKLPVVSVRSLERQLEESLRVERLFARLAGFFGLLALVLASVGLYGVVTHAVVRRTNEIGVRMALGAGRGDIQWMILRETLGLVLAGIAIGVPAALVAARLVSNRLYGLSSADPLTLLVATMVLTAIAAIAGYIPARRASRVDPMVALRCE